jgi:acetoacetyl-[acyl-carrier protein] synthase
VIVGFGGFGPAGRSSNHNAYRRLIFDSLSPKHQQETVLSLAVIMKLVAFKEGDYVDKQGHKLSIQEVDAKFRTDVLNGTLIRRIEKNHFDPDAVPTHKNVLVSATNTTPVSFQIPRKQLPTPLPEGWKINDEGGTGYVNITLMDTTELKIACIRKMPVTSAGQLPTGFDPGSYYRSKSHPRGLSMALLGASDALRSMGIQWEEVMKKIKPDEVSVYSGSAMCQLDEHGYAGYMQASVLGARVSSKQLPLSLNSMPADFINAYVLGSVGTTGSTTGACATFLYNLRAAISDIKAGKSRVVVVGNSEAPLTPEVFDGYHAMSALASDEKLCNLDKSEHPNHRHASRPFGENCGFTLAESCQYFVLMDDELAVELGADILGAVTDVFVNADGHKKSISAPGPGNYITLAKAVAAATSLLGDNAIKNRSFVQAHGSSTPKNRVTEAEVLQRIATSFDIQQWPILAVKSYVGHSLSPASADQLMSTLGVFHHGILPGIKTTKAIAKDVQADRLAFPLQDKVLNKKSMDVAFLNSKGFGGNNATACVISPNVVKRMLMKRYGDKLFSDYQLKLKNVQQNIAHYETAALQGEISPIYKFGENMIDETKIIINNKYMTVPGFSQSVNLSIPTPYGDMIE